MSDPGMESDAKRVAVQEAEPLTTADVKRRYSWGMAPHKSIPGGMYTVASAAADFDRWLTAHDADVRADERAKRPDRAALERIAAECGADIPYDDGNETSKLIGKRIREALALEPEAREEPSAVAKADADTLARVMAKVYEPDLDWENPTDFDLLDRETLTDSARRILERMKWSGLTFWHLDDLVLDEFDPAPRPAPEASEVTDAAQCMLVISASWDATGHQPLPRYVGPFPDRDAAFRWVRHHAPLSGEFNSSPWPVKPEEVSRGS